MEELTPSPLLPLLSRKTRLPTTHDARRDEPSEMLGIAHPALAPVALLALTFALNFSFFFLLLANHRVRLAGALSRIQNRRWLSRADGAQKSVLADPLAPVQVLGSCVPWAWSRPRPSTSLRQPARKTASQEQVAWLRSGQQIATWASASIATGASFFARFCTEPFRCFFLPPVFWPSFRCPALLRLPPGWPFGLPITRYRPRARSWQQR